MHKRGNVSLCCNLMVKELPRDRVLAALAITIPIAAIYNNYGQSSGFHPFEPFISLMCGGISPLLLVLGLLLVLAGAPFYDRIDTAMVYRLGRLRWMRVRVLYVLVVPLLYLLFIFTITIITTWGGINWQATSFSTELGSGAMRIIYAPGLHPLAALGWTFLLNYLLYALMGLLLLALSLYMSRGASLGIVVAFAAVCDFFPNFVVTMAVDAMWSPMYLANYFVNTMPGHPDSQFPSIFFSCGVLGSFVIVLAVVILLRSRHFQFTFARGRNDADA